MNPMDELKNKLNLPEDSTVEWVFTPREETALDFEDYSEETKLKICEIFKVPYFFLGAPKKNEREDNEGNQNA